MNPMAQKILVGACLLLLGSAGTFGGRWLAAASDSHETSSTNETKLTDMEKLVKSNTAVLEKLAERTLEQDAARLATIELCRAGDISKCSVCRGVQVYDAPACSK